MPLSWILRNEAALRGFSTIFRGAPLALQDVDDFFVLHAALNARRTSLAAGNRGLLLATLLGVVDLMLDLAVEFVEGTMNASACREGRHA